jgi:hypothetical protein
MANVSCSIAARLEADMRMADIAFGTTMTETFETRVQAVRWSAYSHPCMQDQSLIPALLIKIRQGDNDARLEAAVRLWDIAAHQGNVGASSVPAAGFLIEMLEELPPPVQVECLDTLYQFSNYLEEELWSPELRKLFEDALPVFKRLAASLNEDARDFSEMIIENIEVN